MNIQILTPELLIQYKKSYFETLSALVISTPLPDAECRSMLQEIITQWGTIFIAMNDDSSKIIWSATVYVLRHLLRWWVYTAHIEEICVHDEYQWQWIWSQLLKGTIDYGRKQWCYKAILNCEEHNVEWYEKYGFERKEVEMKIYL